MRITSQAEHKFDPLHPLGFLLFIALVLLWMGSALVSFPDTVSLHIASRVAGYAAFAGMLVPYLHIALRTFRSQPGWRMSRWLRWHIAGAYVGFAFLLLHCGGRASSPLTLTLLVLTWIVMISGIAGFYGQKLLYALFPETKSIREVGRERLEPERGKLLEAGRELLNQDRFKCAPAAVQEFVRLAIDRRLASKFRFWKPSFSRWAANEGESRYEHSLLMAGDEAQGKMVKEVWQLVKIRQDLDTEYRLHQLGRLWLLFHGPAAWALFVLMFEHVLSSFWYGGF